jgi:hypothetical protein
MNHTCTIHNAPATCYILRASDLATFFACNACKAEVRALVAAQPASRGAALLTLPTSL